MSFIWFILGGIVGFWVGKRKSKRPLAFSQADRNKAQEAIAKRTASRKQRILQYIQREMTHQQQLRACDFSVEVVGVTRQEIEQLLDISDNTARKYLNELEKENKIKQSQSYGSDVTYFLK